MIWGLLFTIFIACSEAGYHPPLNNKNDTLYTVDYCENGVCKHTPLEYMSLYGYNVTIDGTCHNEYCDLDGCQMGNHYCFSSDPCIFAKCHIETNQCFKGYTCKEGCPCPNGRPSVFSPPVKQKTKRKSHAAEKPNTTFWDNFISFIGKTIGFTGVSFVFIGFLGALAHSPDYYRIANQEYVRGDINLSGTDEPATDADACAVCLENKKNVVLGCGHISTCLGCTRIIVSQTKKCPVCRQHITRAFRTYNI